MVEKKMYLRADDICKILDVSRTTAYGIMRQLNEQLAEKGYIIVRGRISRKYFEEQMYGVG